MNLNKRKNDVTENGNDNNDDDVEGGNEKIWLITGTSSGIGLELVKLLIVKNKGHKVSAFTRNPNELKKQIDKLLLSDHKLKQHNNNNNINNDNNNDNDIENDNNNIIIYNKLLLIIKTDITNDENVKESVEFTIKHFNKPIDILVNNAGYGILGSIEELSDNEIRSIYNVNVFGVLNVLRHTIKYFRLREQQKQKQQQQQQNYGFIINISSMVGWINLNNYSAYSSTKHALNSITFTLEKELKPFGVKCILISPGTIKTNFVLGNSFKISNRLIDDYKTNQLFDEFKKRSPSSIGCPEKAAQLILDLTSYTTSFPTNIFMGSDSLTRCTDQLNKHIKESNEYSYLSNFTDYNNNINNNITTPVSKL